MGALLAAYSDAARIKAKHKPHATSYGGGAKNEKAWEYLKIMKEIIMHASVYKEENNVADNIDELEENIKDVETYIQLPDVRQEVFTDTTSHQAQPY